MPDAPADSTLAATTTSQGSCHCGAVRFEVEGPLDAGMTCNCSMCGRAGTILVFIPASRFRQLSGADTLRDYQFGKQHIHHRFCSVCGVKPFAEGLDQAGDSIIAVNLRCVEGLDVQAALASASFYDGASL